MVARAPAARFQLGQLVATPGALRAMEEAGITPRDLISRHLRGDWGDLCEDDKHANDEALKDGSRIFSSYVVSKPLIGRWKFWVITEAQDDYLCRAATTILLPEEY